MKRTRYYKSNTTQTFFSVTYGILYEWDYKNSNTFVQGSITYYNEKEGIETGYWTRLSKKDFYDKQKAIK